jgi:hypothetical protein
MENDFSSISRKRIYRTMMMAFSIVFRKRAFRSIVITFDGDEANILFWQGKHGPRLRSRSLSGGDTGRKIRTRSRVSILFKHHGLRLFLSMDLKSLALPMVLIVVDTKYDIISSSSGRRKD